MIINMSKMHYFFSTILAPHIHFFFFFKLVCHIFKHHRKRGELTILRLHTLYMLACLCLCVCVCVGLTL